MLYSFLYEQATTTNDEDRMWANRYRSMMQQERQAANKNIFTRLLHKIKLTWHHFRISMVPFMLDPWEQALYILGIVLLFYGLVHAVQQCVGIISAWPSMNGGSTTMTNGSTISRWIGAVKPKVLKYLNTA
jgi:hypothetical protein